MKSIAEFVQQGISTLADLQDALQTAMQLEFSTIPPYLCAQWSINSDPSGVGGMIEDVVVQEMFHFALAGNMLSAIGGTPKLDATFVPSYPTNKLPGGIAQKLAVDLQPLSADQLQVFMQIETPEFPPVALAARLGTGPATIGAFYDEISAGFTRVNPTINPTANAVNMGEATPIKTLGDALAAIALIKAEGEGTVGDPDQPTGGTLAHYYVFKEIFVGKQLVETNGQWGFTGAAIQMPTVYSFAQSNQQPDPSAAFNQALTQLLIGLQSCWTSGARPSIGDMFTLSGLGTQLIQQGVRPEFKWDASAAARRAPAHAA
jgi:hypothetical protein